MIRLARILLALCCALALAACGGSSGSTTGSTESCRHRPPVARAKARSARCAATIPTPSRPRTRPSRASRSLSPPRSPSRRRAAPVPRPSSAPSVEEIARPGAAVTLHGPVAIDAFGEIDLGMFVAEGEEVTG